MKSPAPSAASRTHRSFRFMLLPLALLAALWLGAPTVQGATSLSATPTNLWRGESVQVTLGAIGWYDSIANQT